MSDLRTLFGQMLGQKPMEEDEFQSLDRLQRLWYYPVPKGYMEQTIRNLSPTPQMLMDGARQQTGDLPAKDRKAEDMMVEIGQLLKEPKSKTATEIAKMQRDKFFKDMEETRRQAPPIGNRRYY